MEFSDKLLLLSGLALSLSSISANSRYGASPFEVPSRNNELTRHNILNFLESHALSDLAKDPRFQIVGEDTGWIAIRVLDHAGIAEEIVNDVFVAPKPQKLNWMSAGFADRVWDFDVDTWLKNIHSK